MPTEASTQRLQADDDLAPAQQPAQETSTARRRRSWSKLARPAAVTIVAILVAAIVLDTIVVLTFPPAVPSIDATRFSSLAPTIAGIPLAVVAMVLTLRRPRNPTGWLLGTFVVLLLVSGLGSDYVYHWLYGHDLPLAPVAPLALFTAAAGPAFFFEVTALLLVFPDGHLLSKRWRGVLWLNLFLAALAGIPPLFDPGAIGDGHRQLHNPIGIAGAHPLVSAVSNAAELGTFVMAAIGLLSLGIRYRRSDADVRQQIKWFGVGVAVLVLAITVGGITSPNQQSWTTPIPVIAVVIGFTALAACIGVAVLKYGLYDIDFIISRALIYGALAVLITAVYVGIAVGIGTLVGSGGKPNLGLSILATAIVAVGFQPVRERIQKVANRLVYGQRATPYEVLSEFSGRVAETYAADEVLPRMAQVLQEGTAAASATVWLRVNAELRAAATYPDAPDGHPSLPMSNGTLPELPEATHTVEVVHQGELLGALSVTKRRGDGLTPIEEKLVDDLAHQAGLVLKNVGLSADLQARLHELRASRQRLVSAQDMERRRLERNLHDGAQQHLVALKVKVGLAEMLLGRDPAKAAATLEQLKGDADEALETLRDLARGIYPPLLADKGLVVALESQGHKAIVPVRVAADGVGRYGQDVEATVYFCVLEAMQNVQKYAKASAMEVRLSEDAGTLAFEVRDNGVGFDTTTVHKGAGLINMSDRVDALGGHLEVHSEPGTGTRVCGAIPVEALVAQLV
ncbi:MAG: histidine kinase [Candidatus Dormibacteria bacterium]|jgi:signal transduction histidine kinase